MGRYVLMGILALLVLLLLTPVGARILWDGQQLQVRIKFGGLQKLVFPRPKPEKDKPAKAKKQKPPEEKTPAAKPNRAQLLYAVDSLPPLVGRLLKKLRRGLRIVPLQVHMTVAGEDPADAAVLYGRLYGAVAALMPGLRQAIYIRQEDIAICLDFDKTEFEITADVGIAMRVAHLFGIALFGLFGSVRWYLGFKKLAAPMPETPGADTKETTEAHAA